MEHYFNGSSYEIADSNYENPAPRGAYAVAFATQKKHAGSCWGVSQHTYHDCWVVLKTILHHEDDDCNRFYKWTIVKVFGETQLEMAKTFKNTLTELAKEITIAP